MAAVLLRRSTEGETCTMTFKPQGKVDQTKGKPPFVEFHFGYKEGDVKGCPNKDLTCLISGEIKEDKSGKSATASGKCSKDRKGCVADSLGKDKDGEPLCMTVTGPVIASKGSDTVQDPQIKAIFPGTSGSFGIVKPEVPA
ncbi:unnamed protein product [Vitrella brassicaformis CCMP3155]|uniref:Uncharacterized protein n=1 Tax=Vitrella brassicaformis (strain CCMP3155) TaxID=1169540 RepID=A0A0G4F407_VITBC|nr:unnamed protein product [Vitrella brassicaformis CCMP3155]|eukprot:CEM06960.1 unnamed protein product [Vitrella brassicaformis CCMP3155]